MTQSGATEREQFERAAFDHGWRDFTRDEIDGRYIVEGGLELRWIGWQWRAAHAFQEALWLAGKGMHPDTGTEFAPVLSGAPAAEAPHRTICRYCMTLPDHQPMNLRGWSLLDLANGYRFEGEKKVYHCLPAYTEA